MHVPWYISVEVVCLSDAQSMYEMLSSVDFDLYGSTLLEKLVGHGCSSTGIFAFDMSN